MSAYDTLLSRLHGVRPAPARAGIARAHRAICPAHQGDGPRRGRTPSLSVAERDDGAVLVHCHAGCAVHDVVSALGLDLADLFPQHTHHARGIPGGPAAWASAAALADSVVYLALRASARGCDDEALLALQGAVAAFQHAARAAMRKGGAA